MKICTKCKKLDEDVHRSFELGENEDWIRIDLCQTCYRDFYMFIFGKEYDPMRLGTEFGEFK